MDDARGCGVARTCGQSSGGKRRSDSQLRNALHGYAADAGKERVTAHMRSDVLLAWRACCTGLSGDFAQPYAENVARRSFGCYHCHLAK